MRQAHKLPSRRAEAALMAICIGVTLTLVVLWLPEVLYAPNP